MSDPDRKLVSLIEELTDSGPVWPLASAVDEWGRELPARVIADGFAALRQGYSNLDDDNFIPVEEAPTVIQHVGKADDYLILAAPWAPIHLEDEPDLILRYAANNAVAISEVRRRHTERREAWEPCL